MANSLNDRDLVLSRLYLDSMVPLIQEIALLYIERRQKGNGIVCVYMT